MAAAARVHRCDQLHPSWKRDVSIGPRDVDHAGFQRLTQRIEHRALEFGQLVKEQHPQMRGRLSGQGLGALARPDRPARRS